MKLTRFKKWYSDWQDERKTRAFWMRFNTISIMRCYPCPDIALTCGGLKCGRYFTLKSYQFEHEHETHPFVEFVGMS